MKRELGGFRKTVLLRTCSLWLKEEKSTKHWVCFSLECDFKMWVFFPTLPNVENFALWNKLPVLKVSVTFVKAAASAECQLHLRKLVSLFRSWHVNLQSAVQLGSKKRHLLPFHLTDTRNNERLYYGMIYQTVSAGELKWNFFHLWEFLFFPIYTSIHCLLTYWHLGKKS